MAQPSSRNKQQNIFFLFSYRPLPRLGFVSFYKAAAIRPNSLRLFLVASWGLKPHTCFHREPDFVCEFGYIYDDEGRKNMKHNAWPYLEIDALRGASRAWWEEMWNEHDHIGAAVVDEEMEILVSKQFLLVIYSRFPTASFCEFLGFSSKGGLCYSNGDSERH